MDFGTKDWDEMKVLSPEDSGSIRIEKDPKWGYLQRVSDVLEGKERV